MEQRGKEPNTAISVAIRIRPLLPLETAKPVWTTMEENRVISSCNDPSVNFPFNHVYNNVATDVIYEEICSPIVKAFVEGFNATIFVYGQTASGKSYTMFGEQNDIGIIPFSLLETFELFKQNPEREFLLGVQYMEIYNEKITDLLDVNNTRTRIREGKDGSVVVANLTEVSCQSVQDVVNALAAGNDNRTIGETNVNLRSSRAHTIFTILVESRDISMNNSPAKVSSLNLVDLAGSEKPSANESHRFKEGTYINSSLLSLGNVISSLAEGRSHVPYRDSKLTRILQPSLGGNAKTLIICTVSPTSEEETVSTLRFASRAMKVKNKPIINEVMTVEQKLQKEIQTLQEENQTLHTQLSGNLDDSERKQLLSKIEMLGKAKVMAEKKAECLEKQLRKHVVTHPQTGQLGTSMNTSLAMDNRRKTYFVNKQTFSPKLARETFKSSPIFLAHDTVTKQARRQTMLQCRPKNVTFIAKGPEEDDPGNEDDTPIKMLDFSEAKDEPSATPTTDILIQTDPVAMIEKETQTTNVVRTSVGTSCYSVANSDKATQASLTQPLPPPLPAMVHYPDRCVFTNLDQSYLCKHRSDADVVNLELDNALYLNNEYTIQIEELQETVDLKEKAFKELKEELGKKEKQIKGWEQASAAQEEMLCSLQSKLTKSKKECEMYRERADDLQQRAESVDILETEVKAQKSENLKLQEALKDMKEAQTQAEEKMEESKELSNTQKLQRQIHLLNLKLKEVYRTSEKGDVLEENIDLKVKAGELRAKLSFVKEEFDNYKVEMADRKKIPPLEKQELLETIQGLKKEKEASVMKVRFLNENVPISPMVGVVQNDEIAGYHEVIKQLETKCGRYKTELLRYREERNKLRDQVEKMSTKDSSVDIDRPSSATNGGRSVTVPHPAPPTTTITTSLHPAPPTTTITTSLHPAPPTTAIATSLHSAPPLVTTSSCSEPENKPIIGNSSTVDTFPTVPSKHLTMTSSYNTSGVTSSLPNTAMSQSSMDHIPINIPPHVTDEQLRAWGLCRPRQAKPEPDLFDWEQSIREDPDNIGKLPFNVYDKTPEKPPSHPSQCRQQ